MENKTKKPKVLMQTWVEPEQLLALREWANSQDLNISQLARRIITVALNSNKDRLESEFKKATRT